MMQNQNPFLNYSCNYWQPPIPITPIAYPTYGAGLYPGHGLYPVQQQFPVIPFQQQPHFIPPPQQFSSAPPPPPTFSSISSQFPFSSSETPKSNVDFFGRPIFPPCVYKPPQTIQYSEVASKFKDDFGAAIHNACLDSENLLPDGIFLGRGRYSQAAVDHLMRRAKGQNNPIENFNGFQNYGPEPAPRYSVTKLYQNPKDETRSHYFREAFRDEMNNSENFKHRARARIPDLPRQPIKKYLDFPLEFGHNKRYYSKLPNSGGYYMRRRDLVDRVPADYLHERDLIEVVDYPEPEIPRQSFHDNCGCGYVISERPGYNYRAPKAQSPDPISLDPFTLKSSVPWKGLNYRSPKTQKALERDRMNIGMNKRSFDDPGRQYRRMGETPVKFQGFEQQSTFISPPESVTSFSSAFDHERDPSGPPTRNDEPRDYSTLVWSQGLAPMDYSPKRESFVGNLPKRLTPSDMEKYRIHKAAEEKLNQISMQDMVVHSAKWPGQSQSQNLRRSQSDVQVGSIDVVELTPMGLSPNPNPPECDTIFKKDWITSGRLQVLTRRVSEPEIVPEVARPSTTANPMNRQRRARSRMTAGQGFRLKCGVTLTNPKYYCVPPVEELHAVTDSEGNCFVRNFTVGHVEFGNVVFLGEMNVAGLNLDTTVYFAHEELVVYPNPDTAPSVGDGLNRPAIVTLERVWPKEKLGDKARGYGCIHNQRRAFEKTLRKACQKFNGQFVSYDGETGRWVFKVTHFMN